MFFHHQKIGLKKLPLPLTIDGSQLSDAGYAKFAPLLADGVFGKADAKAEASP